MADVREQILARLLLIINGISGVQTSARNVDDLSEAKLPALVLHDGAEEAADNVEAIGLAGNVVAMSVQISILLGDQPENVGTAANVFRAAVCKAVLGDSQLALLCRGIRLPGARYTGCALTTLDGRDIKAEMQVEFVVTYPFNPRAL